MSKTVVIQYKTRPDAAEENQRLVEAVYAQLASEDPGGFHYATFRLEDGVTFVHIARAEDDDNPLSHLAAFAEFQRNILDRCVEPPSSRGATIVGSYHFGL